MKTFTQEEAIAFLKRQQGNDTMDAFAKRLGVSRQLLMGIYKKKWMPGRTVGFERVVTSIKFRRVPTKKERMFREFSQQSAGQAEA
jgi:hypothetical protein